MAVIQHFLRMDSTQYKKEVASAGTATAAFNSQAVAGLAAVRKAGTGVTSIFKTIGMVAAVGGAAIGASFIVGIKAIGEYEGNLRRLAALGGADFERHLDDISDKAMSLSLNFGVSVDEISAGMIELKKSGFEYQDIMDTIESSTLLAVGTQTDLANVIELTRGIMRAFKVDSSEMSGVMDRVAYIADQTALHIENLGAALQYVGAMGNIAGLEVEETVTLIAVMEDQFVKTTKGARGLTQSMLQLTKKADGVIDVFQDMGIEIDAIYTPEGELDIINMLDQWSKLNLTFEDQAKLLEQLRTRAGTAWVTVAQGMERYWEIMNSIGDAEGRAEDLATKMSTSIPVMMERVKAAFVAGIAGVELEVTETGEIIPEGGMEGLDAWNDAMQQVLATVVELAPEIGRLIRSLAERLPAVLEVLAPLLSAFMDTLSDPGVIDAMVNTLTTMASILKVIAPFIPTLIRAWVAWKVAVAAHTIAIGLNRIATILSTRSVLASATAVYLTVIPAWAQWALVITGVSAGLGVIFMGVERGNPALAALGGIIVALTIAMWGYSASLWSAATAFSILTVSGAAIGGTAAILAASQKTKGLGVKPARDGFDGMVPGPTLFLAGEAGPEWVTIRNQQQMRESGTGGDTVYDMRTQNFYESPYSDFQRNAKRLGGLR